MNNVINNDITDRKRNTKRPILSVRLKFFFFSFLAALLSWGIPANTWGDGDTVETPMIDAEIDDDELVITFIGTLEESTDGQEWTAIVDATSPYTVKIAGVKKFYRACGDDGVTNESFTVALSDTVNLDMIWVKPGTFTMGSPYGEKGRLLDDIQLEPQRDVKISKGFWMSKYPVTQAQYQVVTGENPSQFQGDDLPVDGVSWEVATKFCDRLTAREKAAGRLPSGYKYALPTDAQWEYACRARTITALYTGKNLTSEWGKCPNLDEVGWYVQNSNGQSHPVGQKKPNAWGFYDMYGNVFEWCQDWYEPDYGTPYPRHAVTDPSGPGDGSYRVLRGGSWNSDAWGCRSAERGGGLPMYGEGCGIRLVLIKEHRTFNVPIYGAHDMGMIWVEPGTFTMGSPEDELGRSDNETQHKVTLTDGYWLGEYPVTQAQYQAIMGDDGILWFKGNHLPAEAIMWYAAQNFCTKLTEQERAAGRLPKGYKYTLPTEAQWEYACRAGTTTALNNGKNLTSVDGECPNLNKVGWYKQNSEESTHTVGLKKPNAWGFYDMHGNLFEWCLDWYGDYPTEDVTNPTGPAEPTGPFDPRLGSYVVLRGGCWDSDASCCRSAYRLVQYQNVSNHRCGFRVALAKDYDEDKNIVIPLSETVSLEMLWVKPGEFTMGSPEDELGRDSSDETQHQVTFSSGFWLGKYEVTQEQYQTVMGENPSHFQGDNLPVEYVTWQDATNFCAILTRQERAAERLPKGYKYTLPTEAQWEYACRAGTTTALNSGKDLTSDTEICPNVDEVGWYKYNSDQQTHPVGEKAPNTWGFYDMHGNVWEWCLDWYGDYPTDAVTAPTGPSDGVARVVRGGCWDDTPHAQRSAHRSKSIPYSVSHKFGFRIALSPDQTGDSKDIEVPISETVTLEMLWVKPGTFTMGSPKDELGRNLDETQHQVTLTEGFWLGKYEVTQDQYQTLMGVNPSKFQDIDLPVECVTREDAIKFCTRLTEVESKAGRLPEGYIYTLPTEAQWEYACRAGTTTALNSGKDLTDRFNCPNMDEVGWYKYNSDQQTHIVGQKLPNAWGFYDMHGNVWEWCLDWYGDYPTDAVTDPTGPEEGEYWVLRGGCWIAGWGEGAYGCRSAVRSNSNGYDCYSGFRVALSKGQTEDDKNIIVPLSDTVTLDMLWVEPGEFTMGSPKDEKGRDVWYPNDMEEQHQVTLTSGFWLGKYEVTQAQYQTVMEMNPSLYKGDNLPVESLTWFDATNFCAKLTEIEKAAGRLPDGYEYTLPTEAQWEYACRAGTTTALNSGKNLTSHNCPNMDEVGWYQFNSGLEGPHPVGEKLPNAWGFYDMHGNVFEWCLDWYGYCPTDAVTDPTGSSEGSYRVGRGGSWFVSAESCRSAYRNYLSPDKSIDTYGFRVALSKVQ